jgi:hypothetical protein
MGQVLVNLAVSGHSLTNLGDRILIPVVLGAVADEHRSLILDLADQIATLDATSSSEC